MTVQELINALKVADRRAIVFIDDADTGWDLDIISVEESRESRDDQGNPIEPRTVVRIKGNYYE